MTSIAARRTAFTSHPTPATQFDADAVVLATDVGGLQRIVEESPDLCDDDVAGARSAATHGPAVPGAAAVARPAGGPRPGRFSGHRRPPPLDNISVLERYEREAADWAQRTGGSVVELHSYAVRIRRRLNEPMLRSPARAVPRDRGARVVHEHMLCHNDCPLFAPGDYARPAQRRHSATGLVLAGDGVRIDLPVALMERAATTGWTAANEYCSDSASPATSCTRFPPRDVRRCCARSPAAKGARDNEHRRRVSTRGGRKPCRCRYFRAPGGPGSARPTATPPRQSSTPHCDRPNADRRELVRLRGQPRRRAGGRSAPGRRHRAGRLARPARHAVRRPGSCPHLGADLGDRRRPLRRADLPVARDAPRRRHREFGWRTLPSHDDGVLAGSGSTASAAKRRPSSR